MSNKDTELLNWLNYLSAPIKEQTFLGFMEVDRNQDYWCVEFGDDISICGVYKYNEPRTKPVADDTKETEEKAIKAPYVLFFHGGDNTSYIKRFETEKLMMDWYRDTKIFSIKGQRYVYYYNS